MVLYGRLALCISSRYLHPARSQDVRKYAVWLVSVMVLAACESTPALENNRVHCFTDESPSIPPVWCSSPRRAGITRCARALQSSETRTRIPADVSARKPGGYSPVRPCGLPAAVSDP